MGIVQCSQVLRIEAHAATSSARPAFDIEAAGSRLRSPDAARVLVDRLRLRQFVGQLADPFADRGQLGGDVVEILGLVGA
ncbi:hypothetical protein HH308_18100 [Gordonia sp. TBRC 11910]|uniref:Uncharacterized protein n=1 Tax=Gordonia asplenii TaxID=2725283 RepID=A0A848L693_9ACTN|nr:hypothetical protein [Gordonia asplenii]NMO03128.1 hypothetical protein [Gordonia asplenii]